MPLLTNLLNLLLGVVGSLVAWLLLTKALRPRLALGKKLQHLIREDGTVAYRLEYRNPRIRRVEDVHVTVRLLVRTTLTDAPRRRRWSAIAIPVDEAFKPVLGRRPLRSRALAYVRRRRRLVQYPVLLLKKVDDGDLRSYSPSGTPPITDFRDFLEATGAQVELSIRSADGFSGTYRTVARTYQSRDVVTVDRRPSPTATVSLTPEN
jgi:hypothetical protein